MSALPCPEALTSRDSSSLVALSTSTFLKSGCLMLRLCSFTLR